ncbi:MAG: hypothetical protein EBY48_10565 [Opitutae bacterium]|nr:hypothetical protein [Opitutae bacterium]
MVPERYFSHTGREEVGLHIEMASKYDQQTRPLEKPVVSWRNDLRRTLTIVDVVVTDQPGLFEKITGALAITGLNILGARAITREDDLAIDVFYVEGENGGIVEDVSIRQAFETSLESFLADKDCPIEQIAAHRKKSEKAKTFATSDKFGARIPPQVKHIADAGFSIHFARIATEQSVATDVFNIEPLEKGTIPSPRTFLDLRESLGQALHEGKYYHEV